MWARSLSFLATPLNQPESLSLTNPSEAPLRAAFFAESSGLHPPPWKSFPPFFCARDAREMHLARDVPSPPGSGDRLLSVISPGLWHFLVLDVVPCLELQRCELVRFGDREAHDFLNHRVPGEGCLHWPVRGDRGVEQDLHFGVDIPDARAEDKEI